MNKYAGEISTKISLEVCPRCGGSGYIPRFRLIQGGICFLCWGRGKIGENSLRNWERTYTEELKIAKDADMLSLRKLRIEVALVKLQKVMVDLEKGNIKPKEAIAKLKNGIENANITHAVWLKQISTASKELPVFIKNLENEIDELPLIVKELTKQIKELSGIIENIAKQIDDCGIKKAELDSKEKKLKSQIATLNAKLKDSNEDDKDAQDELLALQEQLNDTTSECKKVQLLLDKMIAEQESTQQLQKSTLIEQKNATNLLENKKMEREKAQQVLAEIMKHPIWNALQKPVKLNDIWYHPYLGPLKAVNIHCRDNSESIAEFEIVDQEGIPDIPAVRKPENRTRKFVVNIDDCDETKNDMRGIMLWSTKKDVVYSSLPFYRNEANIEPLHSYYTHTSLDSILPDGETACSNLEFERLMQVVDIFMIILWGNEVINNEQL